MASTNMLAKTTCTTFARPSFSARPTSSRRTIVCKSTKDGNETLRKLAGAAAAAQIALLPFTGVAIAQPVFDLSVDTAQSSRGDGKSPAEKAGNVELPGPAPSLGNAISSVKDVAGGGGGLKEAGRAGGQNISANKATGDLSLAGGVEDVAKRVQQAGEVLKPNAEVVNKGQEAKAAAGEVATAAGDKVKGAATGDLSGVGDFLDKAKEAAPNLGDKAKEAAPSLGDAKRAVGSSAAGNVNLPGPAPSLGETQAAVQGVASGDSDLKAAARSKGANISRTGDALPDGLKPGQYKPT